MGGAVQGTLDPAVLESMAIYNHQPSITQNEDGSVDLESTSRRSSDGQPTVIAPRSRDLSNRKLAQNQTELSKQIVELRNMVSELSQQNELIRRLLEHRVAHDRSAS
jgi:hypothetical protein